MTQHAGPQWWGCAEARIALGVYVLGAIDPAERVLVEAHLAGAASNAIGTRRAQQKKA